MIKPTAAQIAAATAKVRELIKDYSSFYSSMVTDDQIKTEITLVLAAALNAQEPAP